MGYDYHNNVDKILNQSEDVYDECMITLYYKYLLQIYIYIYFIYIFYIYQRLIYSMNSHYSIEYWG